MAKTKRSKKRSKRTRSKSSRSHRIDSSLLLAVLDELNELAGLLRCVSLARQMHHTPASVFDAKALGIDGSALYVTDD